MRIIMLFLLLSTFKLVGQENNVNESIVTITTTNKNDCFFLHKPNEFCFEIKNLGNEPIWIDLAGLFMFSMISDESGKEVYPYLKFEETPTFISPRFVLVKGKSEENICLFTNALMRYELEIDERYNLTIAYFSSIAKKRTKYKTLNEKVNIPIIPFIICSRID